LISIINLIFITNRWIYGLRNEIGVMKCMGIKEGTIIKRIFLEYLIVVFISLILSLGFQQLLYKIILGFDIIYFKVTISNLILGGGIAIVTSVLVLLNPIRKIINQPPIKLLGR
ncbi:MAG: FtsX-like permease family protein, partial [Romboutsia sp.]